MQNKNLLKNFILFYVIPAFNEGAVINETISNLKRYAPFGEIVVVDDGSSDDTGSIASSAGAIVIKHLINRGYGAALQTGILYAIQRNADIVVTFDADGQHDANDISALIEPIINGRCDVVLASRFLDTSSSPNIPLLRRFTLRFGVLFTKFMSRVNVTDAHNGLRAFSKRAISFMLTDSDDMTYASEIHDQIYYHKLTFTEVPCHIKYTKYSLVKGQKSSAAISIAWRYFLEKLRP